VADLVRILAIDDDVGRYDGLRRYLGDRARLDVACCAACIDRLLPGAAAVLLDYDLDTGELCGACGGWPEQVKGSAYVAAVAAAGVPVLVVSASWPDHVASLCESLGRAGVARHGRISALVHEPELRWLGWLWWAGALVTGPTRGER